MLPTQGPSNHSSSESEPEYSMPSVLQFIQSLKLDKADESALVQHIQDCYGNDGGPGLDDRCTDHVR